MLSDLMRARRVYSTLSNTCGKCPLDVDELVCLVRLGLTKRTQLRL